MNQFTQKPPVIHTPKKIWYNKKMNKTQLKQTIKSAIQQALKTMGQSPDARQGAQTPDAREQPINPTQLGDQTATGATGSTNPNKIAQARTDYLNALIEAGQDTTGEAKQELSQIAGGQRES